jgi:hypothetical protein
LVSTVQQAEKIVRLTPDHAFWEPFVMTTVDLIELHADARGES